ncbi:LysM peptidoglycan-binding domain-containing protein [Mesobacillus subterraneus]|uniref:LysM peptidoglycan-binding domain-containing protein n=1 Tax=Mesobacillus subterraneus TaxID=285983 RepID=UPI00273E91A0|nr:LysM peptidoglycan-binding domain-containing protein [Mesobacillus subterraneus]WLR56496.1 LysM peptidoglycan-binding domain-containing protein [Mesobacillus subterraneus]
MSKKGQAVQQGDIIGLMGNTGDSSGVHLHFEIHEEKWTYDKGNAVDPVLALGEATVGQPIVAMEQKSNQVTLETIAKLRLTDDTTNGSQGENLIGEGVEINGQNPVASVPQSVERQLKHTVQRGDTLWSIADHYNTSVEAIKQTNNINNSIITQGDILIIEKSAGKSYVVSSGDTLHSIARKTNTSVGKLKALNNLTSDTIQPQQILITR